MIVFTLSKFLQLYFFFDYCYKNTSVKATKKLLLFLIFANIIKKNLIHTKYSIHFFIFMNF